MADEQKALVRAVATEVMGWLAQTGAASGEEMFLVLGDGRDYKPDFGQEINEKYYTPFNPLTRYDSAGLVIGAMEAKGWRLEVVNGQYAENISRVSFLKERESSAGYIEFSSRGDLRQALCEAALEVARSERR